MSGGPRTVRIAVDAIADRPDRTFTYAVPAGLEAPEPGALVLVPYGRRLALGYVARGEPEPTDVVPRPIEAVVSGPMLTDELLDLAEEISAYYRAPIGTTLAAMLPPGLESRIERTWVVNEAVDAPPELSGLADADGRIGDTALLRRGPRRGRSAWVERLRRSGAVRAEWRLAPPGTSARRVRVLRPVSGGPEPPRRAPLQLALLAAISDGERTLPELAQGLGIETGRLLAPARRLDADGRAVLDWRVEERDPLAHRFVGDGATVTLAAEQEAARAMIAALPPGRELVLQGVAASGKTDVYLAVVRDTLDAGRGAIVLVPEVSLVPQLADRLRATLGAHVAVLHSGLSAGERHDEWMRIVGGSGRVVVGTRNAVFAPLDAGVIILDEAHDGGYKSDRTPRFDARWVARRRAAMTGGRVILGTATPDVVTLARVRGGHSERARLDERRVGGIPEVELVDMRAELAEGNRSIFSGTLADALGSLAPGDQAVLVINRRGASTFILCRDCGESLRCPNCDLPFVYHLAGASLRCHHCGRTSPPVDRCPACASARIRYFGAGTQRVQAELQARFPTLRTARLDSDALGARRGFESVYDDFRDGRADVLVGTQLAAKGLDLPTVRLAAVLAADVTLNLPDYRAAERTFALLAQVAGRAGRGPEPGRVVLQAYASGHYAVRAAAALDVDGFADEELMRRRLLGYPPFSVLARLLVADADRAKAEARAREAAAAVSLSGIEVLGPQPAYVPRRAGRYRFGVVVRAPDAERRAAALERVPPGVAIDVDPESLL